MTHPTDDPLREALSNAIPADGTTLDAMRAALWDTPAGRTMNNKGDARLYWLNEADVTIAALAAAPQPAPAPADERAAMIEVIEEHIFNALGETSADEIADALLAAGWTRGGAEAGLRERERIACALDHEAAVIPCDEDAAVVRTCARLVRTDFSYEAMDDLPEAALACPSAPETLAWAVVGEDGSLRLHTIWASRCCIGPVRPGERVVRVAIRRLEGEA